VDLIILYDLRFSVVQCFVGEEIFISTVQGVHYTESVLTLMDSVTLADVSPLSQSDQLHCSSGALTGSLGLLVQALLAIVAFGALVGEFFIVTYSYAMSC